MRIFDNNRMERSRQKVVVTRQEAIGSRQKPIVKMRKLNLCQMPFAYCLIPKALCFVFFFFLTTHASCLVPDSYSSQSNTTQQNLFIIARPTADSIMLRWAPANHKFWNLGNKYGYSLVRYTVMRDSSLLVNPEKNVLADKDLRPWPMFEWETLVKTNKYGGIAAQAIYGKSFEVDAGEGTTPQNVVYKAKEQKQRFSFALYAADISPIVAKASGLWYTDKTAKPNEMYLYRVFFNLPDSLSDLNDTAFVFTGIRDYAPLPVPIEFNGEFGDKNVVLSWNTFAQNHTYIAWELERSTNGRNFTPVNIDPQVSVMPTESSNPEYSYKYDSLPTNNKQFYYRIRGISSFGERGPWSDIIKGKGLEAIKATPNIVSHEIIKERVTLTWDFPVNMEGSISGFKILRSNNHKFGFKELDTKLKPGDRSFTDKKPLGTNYYKVMAYRDTLAGNMSYPYMVQLTDNTPPVKPKALSGTVDSLGVVRLSWKPNPDEDIYGYRIFRSPSGNDEYLQCTHRPVPDTFYIDTISKKDLNSSVFYKIVAIDLRQNQSDFSDIVELIKPDDIPPSLPVLKVTQATEEGIKLTWINSTSSDVVRHVVYRFIQGDSAWKKIAEIPFKKTVQESEFIDIECATNLTNQYRVVAVDQSGNISEPSVSIAVQGLKVTRKSGLKKIDKAVDYEKGQIYLSWELPESQVKYIKIYRKTSVKKYHLFETLEGSETSFKDYGMKVGEYYAYRIKLIYADGSVSGFSDELKIEF